MSYHFDLRRAPEIVVKVCRAAFPNYTGTKVKIDSGNIFYPNQSWSGGSRTLWKIITREGQVYDPGTQAYADGPFNPGKAFEPHDIPPNCMLVQHSIFGGKDMGLTITVRPDEQLILPPSEPKPDQDTIIVLKYTASLKSSYAGIKNYRFVEARRDTGISEERWEGAKEYCMDKKWLTKAGAITPEGRNILTQCK